MDKLPTRCLREPSLDKIFTLSESTLIGRYVVDRERTAERP
jgi:hypothetical protein